MQLKRILVLIKKLHYWVGMAFLIYLNLSNLMKKANLFILKNDPPYSHMSGEKGDCFKSPSPPIIQKLCPELESCLPSGISLKSSLQPLRLHRKVTKNLAM